MSIKQRARDVVGKVVRRIKAAADRETRRVYAVKDYLEAYSEHTDRRVDRDPKTAVGGMWESMGAMQFDFLVSKGLQPHHRLLDIGCGTLRGGRHFIGYLDEANYTGFDISLRAIESARRLVESERLASKRPRLLFNESRRLDFAIVSPDKFDFILAQSVFSHLKAPHIEECFANVQAVMAPGARFFFTYYCAPDYKEMTLKDFAYPPDFFPKLAEKHGFAITDCSADYPHPRGQIMACLTLSEV